MVIMRKIISLLSEHHVVLKLYKNIIYGVPSDVLFLFFHKYNFVCIVVNSKQCGGRVERAASLSGHFISNHCLQEYFG